MSAGQPVEAMPKARRALAGGGGVAMALSLALLVVMAVVGSPWKALLLAMLSVLGLGIGALLVRRQLYRR